MGFLLGHAVAADDQAEIAIEIERREQLFSVTGRLVGDAAERDVCTVEKLEPFPHAVVDAAAIARVGCIELLEEGERLRVARLGARIVGERPLDEHVDAVAHPAAHPLGPGRREPETLQHAVDAEGDVGQAVHQRAVEIDQREGGQPHRACQPRRPRSIAARMASMVAR